MKAQLTTRVDYIISGGFAYIVSDFGFLVTVNRLVNLQVWADAKLRKKYSQVP